MGDLFGKMPPDGVLLLEVSSVVVSGECYGEQAQKRHVENSWILQGFVGRIGHRQGSAKMGTHLKKTSNKATVW